MNAPHLPGFTAEAACRTVSPHRYRSASRGGAVSQAAAVAPQLWRTENVWQCNAQGQCGWTTTSNWYDDPGGWGVPPWIGDVAERQCRARCNRLADPTKRADCLDAC